MSSGNKTTTGENKGASDAKVRQPATSKSTKNVSMAQNNTSLGRDQDFLFTGKSVNTKEKDLLDKLAESSAKHQESNEENNKLKDQLKSCQDNLKKFEKQADDYKKEVDAKTAEINQLKQNISEMKKHISEIEKQEKLTKPPEKTGVDTLNLQIKNVNQEKTDSSNKELTETYTRENEKNVAQEKIDSSNKEQIERLTRENETIQLKYQELQQQQREESENFKEEINILTAEKESLATVVSQITNQNVAQEKIDSSNKEQIERLTRENEKIQLKYKELQQQQREVSENFKEEIHILTAEKESLATVVSQITNQLSKVAGMKLTEGNPAIADLGDPNRPTELGEKFREMYDNEWNNAMEELDNAGDEKSNINTLKNIVEKSYEFGKARAANYVKGIEKALLDVSNSIEVTDTISKYIKGHRKNTALFVLDGLYQSFVSVHSEYNIGGDGVKNFIKKAVSLCWLMVIQDPPVVLTTKLTGKFDTGRFRHYTQSGSTVDYVVWPVLFLHEGGPIICKGVAQGK